MPNATITYLHHNCFCLQLDGTTFLFDYPDSSHRPSEIDVILRQKLARAEAVFFFSHSHADHCTADVLELAALTSRANYVLSFDVPDLIPELDIEGAAVIDPDNDPVVLDELTLSGLEATDLGVAFLIDFRSVRIYFGGDLAEWAWPTLDPRARAAEVSYFERCLEEIRRFEPHIVFTNADPRLLETRGGIEKLVDTVRPQLVVPMHLFGETSTLRDLEERLAAPRTKVFSYRKTGDEITIGVE